MEQRLGILLPTVSFHTNAFACWGPNPLSSSKARQTDGDGYGLSLCPQKFGQGGKWVGCVN